MAFKSTASGQLVAGSRQPRIESRVALTARSASWLAHSEGE